MVVARHLGDFQVAAGGAGLAATAFSIRIIDRTSQELSLPQSTVAIRTAGRHLIFPSAGISFRGSACFAYSHGNLTLMPGDDLLYPAPLCFVLGTPGQAPEVPTDLVVTVGSTVDFKLE
jgi:hypothetical protein